MRGGEAILEAKLRKFAEAHGVYCRKFTSHHVGVPDRIFIKGQTLFLELKAPSKRPTAQQKDEISTICAVGGFATWVDNYDDGVLLLQRLIVEDDNSLRRMCQELNYWEEL